MKNLTFKYIALIGLTLSATLTSCDPDNDCCLVEAEPFIIPTTYEFNRNGMTTVSYSGQTDRFDQLAEMKSYIQTSSDNKTKIIADSLLALFENRGGNGKQLADKTFDIDRQLFIDMFTKAQIASDSNINNVMATNGKPGFLVRGTTIMLVDENGHEFTQELEKGLMGAIFYNQIVNTYLTEDKIGDAVDNTTISASNYTDMEHHFDEAFGYFGAPNDFKSNYAGIKTPRYWADYSNDYDALIGMNDKLMNAFKQGRQGIVERRYSFRNASVQTINFEFEILIAATTIHYINSSLGQTNDANRLHTLSQGYYFLKALRYSNTNYRRIYQPELNTMLSTDWGTNFWNVSETGLTKIKNRLSSVYGLNTVKNQL